MPINLLHHKSYHVYNAKNIERVRRDEEKAALEKKQEEEQEKQQERANRFDILRRATESSSGTTPGSSSTSKQVNHKHQKPSIKEHTEKKNDDTFGRFAERQNNQTWYLDASKGRHPPPTPPVRRHRNDGVATTPLLRDPEDPLHTMKFFLSQKSKVHNEQEGQQRAKPEEQSRCRHHHHRRRTKRRRIV